MFVTLASLTAVASRGASTENIGLGLGVPRGTECALSSRLVVNAALAAQLRAWTTKGVHGVAVYDPGTLATDLTFAVPIGYFQ